jgi:transposase-like protein
MERHGCSGKTACPRCGSSWIGRSYRSGLIERHVLRAFGFSPYRCDSCDRRFYLRCSSERAPKTRAASLENH